MAAYGNRVYLAYCRDSMESGLADLRRVVDIAREEGHPFFEARVSLGLAELMFWSGDRDECVALARRARLLEERFHGHAMPGTALLGARILAAIGDGAAAARELAWVRAHAADPGWQPRDRLFLRAVDGVDDWRALVEEARAELPPEELLEILWWWRRHEPKRAPEIAAQAEPLLERRPFWRGRFYGAAQTGAATR
jgi:hypothetical protein